MFLTDWKSASEDMKDLEIDQYLAEINVCIDDLGGRINLVGLCQGGWMSAMYAARYPHKVASLVLAGAPIDTDAGDGPIKRMAHAYPTSFYEELVAMGGGLMRGEVMLRGWKGMHPEQHYIQEHIDLYEHIDHPAYLHKEETFERWYENPIDLPGRWYLQAIVQLFKENRLAKGRFVALGRRLDLKDIGCPVYLLAGEADDITPREQVFDAEKYLGTPKERIEKRLIPGGHIGLFMGSGALEEAWPVIARWLRSAIGLISSILSALGRSSPRSAHRRCPYEGLRVLVPGRQEVFDGLYQIRYAHKAAPSHRLARSIRQTTAPPYSPNSNWSE